MVLSRPTDESLFTEEMSAEKKNEHGLVKSSGKESMRNMFETQKNIFWQKSPYLWNALIKMYPFELLNKHTQINVWIHEHGFLLKVQSATQISSKNGNVS